MKHKHYEAIIGWAEGKQIQYLSTSHKGWRDCVDQPLWLSDTEYRIKPDEPKDFAVSARVQFKDGTLTGNYLEFAKTGAQNVEFLFDGETQELKAIRRIKID